MKLQNTTDAEINQTPMAEVIPIRIIRDINNKDGWISRSLQSSKIAFLKNIDDIIQDLSPGQIWEAEVLEEKDNFMLINATHMIRG